MKEEAGQHGEVRRCPRLGLHAQGLGSVNHCDLSCCLGPALAVQTPRRHRALLALPPGQAAPRGAGASPGQ